VNKRSMHS